MPKKEDQMRRRHHQHLALFGMYPPQASLRSAKWIRWRRRAPGLRAAACPVRLVACSRELSTAADGFDRSPAASHTRSSSQSHGHISSSNLLPGHGSHVPNRAVHAAASCTPKPSVCCRALRICDPGFLSDTSLHAPGTPSTTATSDLSTSVFARRLPIRICPAGLGRTSGIPQSQRSRNR